MQALVIDSAAARRDQAQLAFLEVGMQVTACTDLDVAAACLSVSRIDVLLIDKEAVGPRLLDLLTLGVDRNPALVAMLLTSDLDCDVARYHGINPALHCLLEAEIDPRVVAKLALSSMMHAAGLTLPVRVAVRPAGRRGGAMPVFHSARAQISERTIGQATEAPPLAV